MSQKEIIQAKEERAALIKQARDVLDKAKAESRATSKEENETYDRMFAAAEEKREHIDRLERQLNLDRQAADDELRAKDKAKEGGEERGSGSVYASPEYRAAFGRFIRGDQAAPNEMRALQSDADVGGGFLVTPEQFVMDLIKGVDNIVYIRNLATKFQVPSAAKLGAPSLDADADDADWTSELATGSEDTGLSFGKREMTPHPLAKRVKVSNKLLRQVPSSESLVLSRLAYKFGVTQEKGFMTGDGVGKPLGVFTASNDGIPTTRDVSTDNTATEIRFDGLINAKYSLKGQYWNAAQWIFHRDAMKQISKLKDGEGQYIWRESVREGEPDRVLGRPVIMSEYAPNTFTTGQYVGILGDFSWYWIADALGMTMQRLMELYAETNQTGFIGRLETDGMPVLAEAFARVKLA